MTEHTAYEIFLTIVFGGLAVLTLGLIAIAVLLAKRNRSER